MGQRFGILKRTLLVSAFGGLGLFAAARAADPAAKPLYQSTGPIVVIQQPEPQPTQPVQPITPTTTTSTADIPAGLFGRTGGGDTSTLSPERRTAAETTSASVVSGAESTTRATTDAADLLGKSASGAGIFTQHRNPITTDARIRGYRFGQIYAEMDGAYWLPARLDLDTMLSKIDSSNVRDVIVIKGPYSAMYGPGFSFFDIETYDTPRYDCPEIHSRSYGIYETNGEQWYGRQSFWGGNDTAGFRIGYGRRGGVDYESGNGLDVPASYHSADIDLALGLSLSENSRLEFKALRLDQTDVEFPGSYFDMDFLVSDGYSLRYVYEGGCRRLVAEAWYNNTRAMGSTQREPKQQLFNTVFGLGPVFGLRDVSTTDFELRSTGARVFAVLGEAEQPQLTVGADVRRIRQDLAENFTRNSLATGLPVQAFFVPITLSDSLNPGLFTEAVLPVNDQLTIKTGGRLDWVRADADAFFGFVNLITNVPFNGLGFSVQGDDPTIDQDFFLWSVFATGDYKLDDHWTAFAGLGFGQRPPSLTEMYAAAPFVAVLQQGLSRIFGDPHLNPERCTQVDLGLTANYENLRAGLHGYYAWINDYITYSPDFIFVQGNAQTTFVNTDLATLAGFEAYAEVDATCWLTPFAVVSYVEGRDRTRGDRRVPFNHFLNPATFGDEEALPGIPPLEARAGVRVHEGSRTPRWGVEFLARMVDGQKRVAVSLGEQVTPGFTTFDLRGYWQVNESVTLTSGVENLFDRNYREHLDSRAGNQLFQPGISAYLGVEVKR